MDKFHPDGQSQNLPTCMTRAGIRNNLRTLHDRDGLSFPKIAVRAEFSPIPPSTLNSIYHGGSIPKKWHKQLRYPPPRPPRISIRLDNPESAARSIRGHMEQGVIAELMELLERKK
jgi:hypothetical protein